MLTCSQEPNRTARPLPRFPSKRWWSPTQTVAFANNRREELDRYLRELLSDPLVRRSIELQAFLELNAELGAG